MTVSWSCIPVSYTHLDVYKRQGKYTVHVTTQDRKTETEAHKPKIVDSQLTIPSEQQVLKLVEITETQIQMSKEGDKNRVIKKKIIKKIRTGKEETVQTIQETPEEGVAVSYTHLDVYKRQEQHVAWY